MRVQELDCTPECPRRAPEPHLGRGSKFNAVLQRSPGPATCESAEARSPDPTSVWTPKMKTPYCPSSVAVISYADSWQRTPKRQARPWLECRRDPDARARVVAGIVSRLKHIDHTLQPNLHNAALRCAARRAGSPARIFDLRSPRGRFLFPSSIGQRLACLRAP